MKRLPVFAALSTRSGSSTLLVLRGGGLPYTGDNPEDGGASGDVWLRLGLIRFGWTRCSSSSSVGELVLALLRPTADTFESIDLSLRLPSRCLLLLAVPALSRKDLLRRAPLLSRRASPPMPSFINPDCEATEDTLPCLLRVFARLSFSFSAQRLKFCEDRWHQLAFARHVRRLGLVLTCSTLAESSSPSSSPSSPAAVAPVSL